MVLPFFAPRRYVGRAVATIAAHDPSTPLFYYLALQVRGMWDDLQCIWMRDFAYGILGLSDSRCSMGVVNLIRHP